MNPIDPPASPPPDSAQIAEVSTASPRPSSSTAAVVLATLAVGYTLWAAQDLLLPILLAMFFALIGNPFLRLMQRVRIPRFIGATAVLAGGIASAVLLGNLLAEPAGQLFRQLPREMTQLAPKLHRMIKPMQEAKKGAENIARAAGGEVGGKVKVVRTEIDDPYRALTTTPRMVASALAVLLLTFFFMVYGESLQRKVLALLPGRQQKKLTVEIMQSIERQMSRYVLTITAINLVVGALFAAVLVWLGLPAPEAMMWGTLATLLNYAPYIGPLTGAALSLLTGLVHFDDPVSALMPAGAYLLLHVLESQLLTPILLGRRMALSPLALIIGLMVFGWLWGIIGMLLAVPLLVCTRLVLERLDGMEPWARLLE